jgi:hypothetical protein
VYGPVADDIVPVIGLSLLAIFLSFSWFFSSSSDPHSCITSPRSSAVASLLWGSGSISITTLNCSYSLYAEKAPAVDQK